MSENADIPQNEVTPKVKMPLAKKILIGAGIFIALSIIGGIAGGGSTDNSSSNTESTSTSAAEEPEVDVAPWYPDGYFEAQEGIAFKWMTTAENNASDACTGDWCWGAYAIARDGCPSSLYAEITISDSQGVQIGYTNDSVGSVAPGTKVRIMFNTYEDSAKTAKLAKISCY